MAPELFMTQLLPGTRRKATELIFPTCSLLPSPRSLLTLSWRSLTLALLCLAASFWCRSSTSLFSWGRERKINQQDYKRPKSLYMEEVLNYHITIKEQHKGKLKINHLITYLASIIGCLLVFPLVAMNLPLQLGDVVLQGGDEVAHLSVDGPGLLVGC